MIRITVLIAASIFALLTICIEVNASPPPRDTNAIDRASAQRPAFLLAAGYTAGTRERSVTLTNTDSSRRSGAAGAVRKPAPITPRVVTNNVRNFSPPANFPGAFQRPPVKAAPPRLSIGTTPVKAPRKPIVQNGVNAPRGGGLGKGLKANSTVRNLQAIAKGLKAFQSGIAETPVLLSGDSTRSESSLGWQRRANRGNARQETNRRGRRFADDAVEDFVTYENAPVYVEGTEIATSSDNGSTATRQPPASKPPLSLGDQLALEDLQMLQRYLLNHADNYRNIKKEEENLKEDFNRGKLTGDDVLRGSVDLRIKYLEAENKALKDLEESTGYSELARYMIDSNNEKLRSNKIQQSILGQTANPPPPPPSEVSVGDVLFMEMFRPHFDVINYMFRPSKPSTRYPND